MSNYIKNALFAGFILIGSVAIISHSLPAHAEADWDKGDDHENDENDPHRGGGEGDDSGKDESIEQVSPIDPSFKQNLVQHFQTCAQKALGNSGACTLKNMGTARDPNANYGAKNSCHKIQNPGPQAIDIGGITCGGASAQAKGQGAAMASLGENGESPFDTFAKCMANETNNAFHVIYRQGVQSQGNLSADTSGKHEDHVHIMVPGCSFKSGGHSMASAN